MKIKTLLSLSLIALATTACSPQPSPSASSKVDGYLFSSLEITQDTREKLMAGQKVTPVYEVTLTPIPKDNPNYKDVIPQILPDYVMNPAKGMVCSQHESDHQTVQEKMALRCVVTKENAPLSLKIAIEANELYLEDLKPSQG